VGSFDQIEWRHNKTSAIFVVLFIASIQLFLLKISLQVYFDWPSPLETQVRNARISPLFVFAACVPLWQFASRLWTQEAGLKLNSKGLSYFGGEFVQISWLDITSIQGAPSKILGVFPWRWGAEVTYKLDGTKNTIFVSPIRVRLGEDNIVEILNEYRSEFGVET